MKRFLFNQAGASAAEFALVLPLLLVMLFGIIDAGRLMWSYNRAEKAAQMGVRFAIVTDMVATDLATRDFALNGGAPGGNPVPTSLFDSTTCNNSSCSPGSWGYSATAFTNILQRVRFFLPEATASDVTVTYKNIGLGFAGDPNGPDVSPLVTLQISGLQFQPLLLTVFGGSFDLPAVDASLTGEDMDGTISN